ncbi:MAG: acyltransferase [Deltaproteobacteria bacterium]|nr:acyltransferase [Deltaproteobacteria bacterium]
MVSLRRFFARSEHPVARTVRTVYRGARSVSVPAPRAVVVPLRLAYVAARDAYDFSFRVLVAEPMFKAACKRYGRRLRTDNFIHWVQGSGDLIVGDDVAIDGKCSFSFASRFSDHPTLEIGDRTEIGHDCTFTVAKAIRIGKRCRLSAGSWFFDSNGHPVHDAAARAAGAPPSDAEVRPITIGDDVWIGGRCIIFPGTVIGDGCVISAGSIVRGTVPPYSLIAGNPAKKIASLPRPDGRRAAEPEGSP